MNQNYQAGLQKPKKNVEFGLKNLGPFKTESF